jgi:hypothetical protein
MGQDPDRQKQQRDEQEKEQQPFQLLSAHPDDAKDLLFLEVDDISVISSRSPGPIGDDDDINNKNNHYQENSIMNKQKRNKVVSFRLSEPEYTRYLSVAKICHQNSLTNKPDIVSFIRVSMECITQYIISQTQGERSAEKEHQQQLQKKQERGVEHQDLNYHAITPTSSSTRAAAESTTTNANGEDSGESIITRTPSSASAFNIFEYFQLVFEELDKMNKMLDSFIEEENDKWKEKKK